MARYSKHVLYGGHEQDLCCGQGFKGTARFDQCYELVGVRMALSSNSAVLANPSVGIG